MTACGDKPQATLLVTDANGLFGLAVDTVRLMQLAGLVPPVLVVGVGYPPHEVGKHPQTADVTLVDTVQIRARDLTPTLTSVFVHGGGADAFAQFIDRDLRALIADRFPAAVSDLTYFGHSLGGLFGCHVMLSHHEIFNRYIISSPSLWWDSGLLFDQEATRATDKTDLATTAFFGIGALETDAGRRLESRNLPEGHPAKAPAAHLDMVEDMHRFIDALRSRDYPNLVVEAVVIADEFHTTVPGIVLNRGLRHAWMHRNG